MVLNQTGLLWLAFSVSLLVWVQGGFTALHAGLMRPKNTVNVAATKLVEAALAALLFWAFGSGLLSGRSAGGFAGVTGFITSGANPAALAVFAYQLLLCVATVTIVSGALGERMSFRATLALAAFVAAVIFPFVGHWAWAHEGTRALGWLRRTGFVDFAGSTVVHSAAGWAALAAILCVGNRSGRYARSGKPVPLGRASIPLAAFGLFAVWIGWVGAIGGASADALDDVPSVVLAALLSSAAGGLSSAAYGAFRQRLVDLDDLVRGVLAGIAAVGAGAHALSPGHALFVGAIAGLVAHAVLALLTRWRIDDAVGAVPAHLGGGIWGTIAVALFCDPGRIGTGLHPAAQLAIQLEGVAVCAAWSFGLTWLFCKGLARVTRLRVAPDEEFIGLNVSEHQTGSELMDLLDALEETARHETPIAYGEPFAELARLVVEPGGIIKSSTPAASAIFGYAEGELRKLSIIKLVSPEPESFEALRAELSDTPRELVGMRRTGEEFPMEIAFGAAPPGEEGEGISIRDITARKESEEMLTRTQDGIRRRLDRELGDTPVVSGGGADADIELPGADVSQALPRPIPAGQNRDWFGWFHDPSAKAITLYAGELVSDVRGAASLLSSVLSTGGYEPEYTHGLLLGNARYPAERQLRNLADVLGRIVAQEGRGELTMTMSFAHVDLATGALTFVNAGRRAPALLRTGRTVRPIGGGAAGSPLGRSPEAVDLQVTQASLSAGDVLLFHGDGLVDTISPDGSILRLGELKKVLLARSSAAEICDDVVSRANAVWKEAQADSHAVLVFKWRP